MDIKSIEMENRNIAAMEVYCMVIEQFFAAAKEISKRYEQGFAILQATELLKKAGKETKDKTPPNIMELFLEVVEFISQEAFVFSLAEGIETMRYPSFEDIQKHVYTKFFKKYCDDPYEKELRKIDYSVNDKYSMNERML